MVLFSIGISTWHMYDKQIRQIYHNQKNQPNFEKDLIALQPRLRQLAKATTVIWMNQFPTIEKFAYSNESGTEIYSARIERYNQKAREILK